MKGYTEMAQGSSNNSRIGMANSRRNLQDGGFKVENKSNSKSMKNKKSFTKEQLRNSRREQSYA